MRYHDWDRFKDACSTLCRESVRQPRTCIRWRHEVGLLVFKVTDDCRCLTFKTRSTTYLNRIDALNRAMLRLFQNERWPVSPAPESAARSSTVPPAAGAPSGEPSAAPAGHAVGGTEDSSIPKAKKRRSKKKAK